MAALFHHFKHDLQRLSLPVVILFLLFPIGFYLLAGFPSALVVGPGLASICRDTSVTAGIDIQNGIIAYVFEEVPALRLGWILVRKNIIWPYESSEIRCVVTGSELVQPALAISLLTTELEVVGNGAGDDAFTAEGVVVRFLFDRACAADLQSQCAEVV